VSGEIGERSEERWRLQQLFRCFRLFRKPTSWRRGYVISGYLKRAKQTRTRRTETRSRADSEAIVDEQAIRQYEPIYSNSESHELEASGFEPKERDGKITWQRPDTGLWVSQEIALHLLERKSTEGDQRP
jgi:hypothetical protein